MPAAGSWSSTPFITPTVAPTVRYTCMHGGGREDAGHGWNSRGHGDDETGDTVCCWPIEEVPQHREFAV